MKKSNSKFMWGVQLSVIHSLFQPAVDFLFYVTSPKQKVLVFCMLELLEHNLHGFSCVFQMHVA